MRQMRKADIPEKRVKTTLFALLLFTAFFSGCTKYEGLTSKAAIQAQGVIDDNMITQYLKGKGLTATTIDTTGVRYIIDTAGASNSLYTNSTSVTVSYSGMLLGYTGTAAATDIKPGAVFAQTDNFHPSFVLGAVIRGWQLGIPEVGQGGTITLFVPSRYAYGPYAQPNLGLPANAVLIFVITVYNVTN
jgi:FKBP-type peptidyl-prolyl cis-trans isomerase FkpA